MRKMKCRKCNSVSFYANPKANMIQCQKCKQRYIYSNGKWIEFSMSKEIVRIARKIYEDAKKKIELVLETTGQIRKRLGIKKVKKPKQKPVKRKLLLQPDTSKQDHAAERIKAKWRPIIAQLNSFGSYRVTGNTHYGALRGRDILRHAKRDLRKIGIKTKLTFDDNYGGTIEVVR